MSEKLMNHTGFCTVPYDHEGPCQDDEGNDRLEPQDERIEIPENFYKLLEEAINTHYKKVCDEGEELVQSHKDHITPTAVFRPAYETQTKRIGESGMLIQWFRQGFRMV